MFMTLIAFAFAIGLLVVIHELGHYWVARWCGVHIERFSFGFGKVLARYTDKRGCEWAFSAIPLGGYVMMRNEAPPAAGADYRAGTLKSKNVWQRIAIAAAGPFANLVLAALLYALMSWMGTTEPAAVVAEPPAESPAAMAGIQPGDKITAVDKRTIESWAQLRWQLLDKMQSERPVELAAISAQGQQRQYILNVPAQRIDPSSTSDPLEAVGLFLYLSAPQIQSVVPGGAAERAGLREGDSLLAIDGQAVQEVKQFVDWVQAHPKAQVPLEIERDGHRQIVHVTIDAVQENDEVVGRIGAMLGARPALQTFQAGFLQGLTIGVERTAETFWFSLKMLGRVITGHVSPRAISGPVTIADYAGQSARIGIAAYIQFLALISVSIGLLNLLPIPMLDGGHLLYYAIEAFRGKPLSEKWQAVGQQIGLAMLAGLMALAFVNDFTRILQ